MSRLKLARARDGEPRAKIRGWRSEDCPTPERHWRERRIEREEDEDDKREEE